jgi:hypothetical protein
MLANANRRFAPRSAVARDRPVCALRRIRTVGGTAENEQSVRRDAYGVSVMASGLEQRWRVEAMSMVDVQSVS